MGRQGERESKRWMVKSGARKHLQLKLIESLLDFFVSPRAALSENDGGANQVKTLMEGEG